MSDQKLAFTSRSLENVVYILMSSLLIGHIFFVNGMIGLSTALGVYLGIGFATLACVAAAPVTSMLQDLRGGKFSQNFEDSPDSYKLEDTITGNKSDPKTIHRAA